MRYVFWYDTKSSEVSNIRVWSHFMYTDKSTKNWFDDCSYGQCFFIPENEDEWKELVECIKDKEWTWTGLFTSKNEKISDEGQKEKIIQERNKYEKVYIGCESDYLNSIKEIFSEKERNYGIEILFLVYSDIRSSQIIFEDLMKKFIILQEVTT